MIAPSALEAVHDLAARCTFEQVYLADSPWVATFQCCRIRFHSVIPLDIPSFDGFAVVPTSGKWTPAEVWESLKKSTERLEWLRMLPLLPGYSGQVRRDLGLAGTSEESLARRDSEPRTTVKAKATGCPRTLMKRPASLFELFVPATCPLSGHG